MQTPDCIKMKKLPDQQKLLFVCILSVSVQNMVAHVRLPIVIFVLVYSLTINEEAVTFPGNQQFYPPLKRSLLDKRCHYTILITPSLFTCILLFKYNVLKTYNLLENR